MNYNKFKEELLKIDSSSSVLIKNNFLIYSAVNGTFWGIIKEENKQRLNEIINNVKLAKAT